MKIGFVVAMSKEMQVFLARLDGSVECRRSGGFSVYVYKVANNILYMVDSGVGEISSACATYMLASTYGVDMVINFGVCGSLNPNLDVADIVYGESVYHFDRDTSKLDGVEVGYYTEFNERFLSTDQTLLEKAKALYDAPIVKIASSEKFVADSTLKGALKEAGADVCEMESAGVLVTAKRLGLPCLIIKAVSDKADEQATISFSEMLTTSMQKCSEVIYKLIKSL